MTPGKQHGQIRGYQVHYVRVENGESRGLPLIKDVMLADAQVWTFHSFLKKKNLDSSEIPCVKAVYARRKLQKILMSAFESVFHQWAGINQHS